MKCIFYLYRITMAYYTVVSNCKRPIVLLKMLDYKFLEINAHLKKLKR